MFKFTIESMAEISRFSVLIGASLMLLILPLAWWAGVFTLAFNATFAIDSALDAIIAMASTFFFLLNLWVVYRTVMIWTSLALK